MSKFRVETSKVISSEKGTIGYELILQDKALALFSQSEHNAIVREAMAKAVGFWLNVFLPKRFSDYAYKLGYRISQKYKKSKRGQLKGAEPTPLVYEGLLVDAALQGANAHSTATKGKPSAIVRIPTGGHALAPIVTAVLRTVPNYEVTRVAETFGQALADIINNTEPTSPTKSRLTGFQRVAFGLKQRKVRTHSPRKTGAKVAS